MLVLGWHGSPRCREFEDNAAFAYHDGAAVLLENGRIVAAIEEERLNRVKHSSFFPARAIRCCLAEAGATLRDVDVIVTDSSQEFQDLLCAIEVLSDPRHPHGDFRKVVAATFEREFQLDVSEKLRFCKHHWAHLCSAWYPAGYPEGLAVCLDGDGDNDSGLIAYCGGDEFKILRTLPAAQSLGNFYTRQMSFLGYQRFDEYKAMGLAPYGNPRTYEGLFQRMVRLQPEGRYALASEQESLMMLMGEPWLLAKARRKGEPFSQEHKDFAAGLQQCLERVVQHVVGHFQRATGTRRLCLSGGVAHNCTLNGRLMRSGLFERIYIQPAAHDAGNALGAALNVLREAGQPVPKVLMPHVFLGKAIGSADEIEARLAAWGSLIQAQKTASAPETAAELIAQGAVIAWVQGRSEFGPRALGNRSILADPRPAENKRIINAMVKKREAYRPFAPSVIEERLTDFFEVPPGADGAPFMILALPVRPEARAVLGAVTHVDGSARVQSVSRVDNPRYHALIEAFGRRTGVPVVLNTSFNNNAEPIVDSVDDAVTTFLTTGLHFLVIGDWLVRKAEVVPESEILLDLVPSLAPSGKLLRRTGANGKPQFCIESTASRYMAQTSTPVSPEVFQILLREDVASIRARCAALPINGVESPGAARIGAELFELWVSRVVRLLPAQATG